MARSIQARRKLSALYQRGLGVRFTPQAEGTPVVSYGDQQDGSFEAPEGPDDVTVWVTPPSPLQREMALREAQAARAKALLRVIREKESGDSLSVQVFVADMADETLVDYLLLSDQDARQQEAMREVLAWDEWKDMSDYQEALGQYEDENGKMLPGVEADEDYQNLIDLDAKFTKQVNERAKEITDAARDALEHLGRAEWERRASEKRGEMVGSQTFVSEYERQMVFYAVRDYQDRGVLFYESARELASEPDEVQTAYSTALMGFISEARTAKNSPGAAAGSDSSAPPSTPETSESSTPEAASA